MNSVIGDRLSEFYVALRQSETKRLVRCLYHLEVSCIEQLIGSVECSNGNETYNCKDISTLYDIIDDCRKKCAHNLRSLYVEYMNSLISSTKKLLLSKIKKNQINSNVSKYIHVLTELLGSLSNVISELQTNYIETVQNGTRINYMSASLLLQTVLPMHTRVINIVFHYFKEYIEDKQLLKLQGKTIQELNSVIQLDSSIVSFIQMKDITYQYVMFLLNSLLMQQQEYQENINFIVHSVTQTKFAIGPTVAANRTHSPQLPLPPGVAHKSTESVTSTAIVHTESEHKYKKLLAFLHVQFRVDSKTVTGAKGITVRHYQGQSGGVSTNNANDGFVDADLHMFQFREYDPLYTTLENLYLSKSVLQALYGDIDMDACDPGVVTQQMQLLYPFSNNLLLIDGEEPTDPLLSGEKATKHEPTGSDNVYVMECIEDVCFIFTKVMERVLMCNENTSILAMSNKIIEYIDPMQESMLYQTLLDKTMFKNCYKSFRQKQKEHVQSILKQRELDLVTKFPTSSPSNDNGTVLEVAPLSGSEGVALNGVTSDREALSSSPIPPDTVNSTDVNSGHVFAESDTQIPSMAGVDVAVNATAHMINNISELSSTSMGDLSSWWGTGDAVGDGGAALLSSFTNFGTGVVSNAVQTTTQLTGVDVNELKMDGSLLLQGTNTLSNVLFQQDILPRTFGGDARAVEDKENSVEKVPQSENTKGNSSDGNSMMDCEGNIRGNSVEACQERGPVTLRSLNDISVYISSLCVFYSTIMSLGDMMYTYYDRESQYYSSITEASILMNHSMTEASEKNGWASHSSMYLMVLQEFERCRFYYKTLITDELHKYMSPYLKKQIIPMLHEMMDTYNITGYEYDIRRNSEDCPLLIELKISLGVAIQSSAGVGKSGSESSMKTGYIIKELKPGLSNIAYKHLLYGIGSCISETIISILFTKCVCFSEWGALLLEEEIHSIIELLEDATIDVADFDNGVGESPAEGEQAVDNNKKENIALLFHRLVWCMKLMTLDQVIDIKRYRLPLSSAGSDNKEKPSTADGLEKTALSNDKETRSDFKGTERDAAYIVENDIFKDTWQNQVQISGKPGNCNGNRILFNEQMIRCLLSRRVEFSRDAVAKIKFNQ